MKKWCIYLSVMVLLFSYQNSYGKGKVILEFLPGVAGTLPMPLTVYQNGELVSDFTARYEVRSLESPIYYSYRIGYMKNQKGFELEMNHLKIYLTNTNSVVSHFSVSHGYNQVWLNYIWEKKYGIFRVGLGPVISHDETTVNGLRLDETGGLFNDGYHIAGLSVQFAYQYRYSLSDNFFLSAEAKTSAAYGEIKVVNGYAATPVVAYSFLIGAGFAF